jgi:hypothetical protein
MSAYSDFIVDFPTRCLELLQYFEPQAKARDREVTLLLMAASSAFIIPYERLNKLHPTRDFIEFKTISESINNILGTPFKNSNFSPIRPNNWKFGTFHEFGNGPDSWQITEPAEEKPLSYILGIIRNSLAHGNLYTSGNPISFLIFFCENRKYIEDKPIFDGYKCLKVPVHGFREFLLWWFESLLNLKVPYNEVLYAIAEATRA